tara:strand:- start:835 stop:1683 length:849 start_codon:yes stop_codon:yes gene_type:complete
MRSGGTFILLLFLVLAQTQPVFASHGFGYQRADMLNLEQTVWMYYHHHSAYPVTDNTSTWYQKLTEKYGDMNIRQESPDGRYPLDFYGHPLLFEPPGKANGNSIVIRSVGRNGIDDGGALDDWDSRFGPNLGYWYKMNWPAAYRRAWICGILGLVGTIFIIIKIKQSTARYVYILFWLGVLGGVVMPLGFDTAYGRHSASIDPIWIGLVSGLGGLLICSSIIVLAVCPMYTHWRRRLLRVSGVVPCEKCDYDLRGTIAANIDRCPECGESIPADADRDVDLT